MIVTFSGACNSGKTTAMNNLHTSFPDNIIIHDEIIRSVVENIDEIRKRPLDYMKLQAEIILKKRDEERKIKNHDYVNDVIHIFDRSLADSFYYLTHFVDVSNFTTTKLELYNDLVMSVYQSAQYNFQYVYDKVVLFEPLSSDDGFKDALRPENLKNIQFTEYMIIKTFTEAFAKDKKQIMYWNVGEHNDSFLLLKNLLK